MQLNLNTNPRESDAWLRCLLIGKVITFPIPIHLGYLGGVFVCFCCVLFGSNASRWKEILTLLDFVAFLKVPRIAGKSLPHPVGTFSILPHPPKYHV